ncbi:ABC transporter permease [Faucicola boevrei]|uniref:ABC transporter permease n=1 Tax=Faucicola boevrei TaxID=346665 RepID=UPI0003798975|nr:ABC transporter permease [Moraxella boevrei]
MLDLQGYGHLLLSGSVVTMKLALTSLVIGLILGLFGAIAKLSRFKVLQAIATAYTTFVRGIPELLSVLFIYFGGTMLLGAILSKFGYTKYVEISQFWAGVMALSFAFGAYATETFRMAFQEIPKGQDEAGQAIGLNRRQIFWRIKMPQMWRLALPGLGNLFLVLLKDTALVSVVGLEDIMRQAVVATTSTQKPFTFYMTAALMYLAMTVVVTGIIMWLEWLNNPAERYAKRLQKQARLTQGASS